MPYLSCVSIALPLSLGEVPPSRAGIVEKFPEPAEWLPLRQALLHFLAQSLSCLPLGESSERP
jgi:hypothetical protein